MTGKEVRSRRSKPIRERLGKPERDVELTQRRYGLVDAGDDLVRILMKLAVDVERFDAMVSLQRELLQREGAFESDQLDFQWDGLRSEAALLLTSVRQALERLRRLSEIARPVLDESPPDVASALARDRLAN